MTQSISFISGHSCNRPRVLHMRVVSGHGGGPDKTILRSLNYADALDVDMYAAWICPDRQDDIEALHNKATAFGQAIDVLPERGAIDISTVKRALKLCKKYQINIWHAHDYKTNVLGLLLRPWYPMHLVSTVHGWVDFSQRARWYYRLDRLCLKRYEHVFAVSRDLTHRCRRMGCADYRVTYLPNAIETDQFKRDRSTQEAKQELNIRPDTLVIGMISRLNEEKRVADAIHTFALLTKRHSRLELHIAGDGVQRHELKQLAESLGLSSRIHFHGWIDKPAIFYQAMDVYLLTSIREGLPNTVLEALAYGVPVAATPAGGTEDLLDDGAGMLLPIEADHQKWADMLSHMLRHQASRNDLAKQGRQRVEQQFDFTSRMQRLGHFYHRLKKSRAINSAHRLAA